MPNSADCDCNGRRPYPASDGRVPVSLPTGGLAGTAGLLVVLGLVLFVLPEPVTSVLGVLVLLAGVVWWLL